MSRSNRELIPTLDRPKVDIIVTGIKVEFVTETPIAGSPGAPCIWTGIGHVELVGNPAAH
jgi:hypothetical protein